MARHLMASVKSLKAHLEAMHNSRQSDFERDFEQETEARSNERSLLSAGRTRPCRDFEHNVRKNSANVKLSSAVEEKEACSSRDLKF